MTLDIRTWYYVCMINTDDCWLYAGYKVSKTGYGLINYYSKETKRQVAERAHRVAYRSWVGEIPEGLELDHLCRVTSCINPSHLEAVTGAENLRRRWAVFEPRDACKRGHVYGYGTYYEVTQLKNGKPYTFRQCKKCSYINKGVIYA